ncbi:hypothetical protein L6654_33855 [Bradyrhizobium sp. WYCCWR 13023]|uniref:Uncharacterized protein n=1 Tax=Bradyrhizobium zhengyangense TaxID=2911009 RepID=A0A9X1RHF0_9BRAD|nr:hypothetical protein [Bradyrhizobium zhengyangense]MCG2631625.1 hypothetical protein [Bradyrhizobium zhengyangense]
MKIKEHGESHIVELENGTRWRIFPGDFDVTLLWKPNTDLTLVKLGDTPPTHALVSEDGPVRVISAHAFWPEDEVEAKLSDG